MPRVAFESELRLVMFVALNAGVFGAAYRLSRRSGTRGRAGAAADGLLGLLVVQYIAVCVPGVAGVLMPLTMAAVAIVCAGAMWWLGGRMPVDSVPAEQSEAEGSPPLERAAVAACVCFAGAFLAAFVYAFRHLPPLANDSLTYHLPAAAQWLQQGRIAPFETWFFNPANTYSPLAGSAFAAWSMGLLGNDVLARFVQLPALALLMLSAHRLARAAGAPAVGAALLAVATGLSRPFVGQSSLAKDDLFVAAFFATVVAAVVDRRRDGRDDPLASWRAGVAVGLLLATKYTVVLALPALLPLADAGWRRGWRWKRHAVVVACAAVLAGPWYLRNWLAHGNPLFPSEVAVFGATVFPGMFATTASPALRDPLEAARVLGGGYLNTPALAIALLLVWLAAAVWVGRRALADPLARVVVLGVPLNVGAFLLVSPYAEGRFVYPAIVLMFACAAHLPRPTVVAAALLVVAVATAFTRDWVAQFTAVGLCAAAAGGAGAWAHACVAPAVATNARWAVAGCAAAAIALAAYVEWNAYLGAYRDAATLGWRGRYGDVADAWDFVRRIDPADATVAYAGTLYPYPLQGFDLRRPIVYAPTRRGVDALADLPRLPGRVTGDSLVPLMTAATRAEPDQAHWLNGLRRGNARYLFVERAGAEGFAIPEVAFAEADPARFTLEFGNEAARVYRIVLPSSDQSER